MEKQKLEEWLNTPCPETDLSLDDLGYQYLSINKVKEYLDYALETYGMRANYTNFVPNLANLGREGGFMGFGSIDVEFGTYKLVGAANVMLSDGNIHWAATIKSLCIVNALRWRFNRFGRHLNQLEDDTPETDTKSADETDISPTDLERRELLVDIEKAETFEQLATLKPLAVKLSANSEYMSKLKQLTKN